MEIALLVILIMFSAFFSASETALTTVSRFKISKMLEKKVRGARLLADLREDPSSLLSTILIGNNIVNIWASVLAASVVIRFFEARGYTDVAIPVGITTGVMTILILVFGEITPKTIAIHNSERLAPVVAPIVWVMRLVLKPVVLVLMYLGFPFVWIFGGRKLEKGPFMSEEEIKMVLSFGAKEGVIEAEEKEMISSIFEFTDTVVREVMTPRPDIKAIDVSTPLPEVVNIFVETGHSRLPVFENNIDNIIGILYSKDLLRVIKEKQPVSLSELARPALIIPESKMVDELLHQMQAARTHVAVVVDEYGVTAGLVSLEDLIEEIVGEIHDEFEREVRMVEKLDKDTYLVDAKISISDLNENLKLELPEKGYDTLAGFVFDKLGKVPAVGDVVRYKNLVISVERVLKRRVTRVKIAKGALSEDTVGG